MIFSLFVLMAFAVVLAAIVLLTLGIRGRAVFSEPRCAACGYDLRAANYLDGKPQTCPECGRSLEPRNAISFGRYQRRRGFIIAGILLILLPVAILLLLPIFLSARMVGATPATAATRTNAQLITALATTANQPWDWQELERRYTAGNLSAAEADQAMAALATHMRSLPRSEPLHWCDSLVGKLLSGNMLSTARVEDLCASHFKDPVQIEMPLVSRAGATAPFSLHSQHAWRMANHQDVWFLKQVLAGDQPLQIRQTEGKDNPDLLSADRSHSVYRVSLTMPATPGEHELTFVFDHGAVPETEPMRGTDGRPGTPGKWRKVLSTWQVQQKVKVRIVPKDQSPVELVSDPTRDPGTSLLKRCLIRPRTGGSEAVLEWNPASTVIYGRLTIRLNGESFPAGNVWISNGGGQQTNSLPALPPGGTADLLIEPLPDLAEENTFVRSIWGKPIELKGVPLERADQPAK